MAHTLIIGQTESGKTALAKQLCAHYMAKGVKCIILDSAFNDWPPGALVFSTQGAFLAEVLKQRNCALFIDEAGEEVGTYQTEAKFIATKGRHLGHFAHFITQAYKQINKTVRAQCSVICLFNVCADDADEAARDYNCDGLRKASGLRKLEYLHYSRFGECKHFAVKFA